MERNCVVCHEKLARHRCLQCHKPVCNDCAFKTEAGVFCGREHAAAYREFKQHHRPAKKRSGVLGKLIAVIVLLLIAALVARQMGWLSKAQQRVSDAVQGGAESGK